MVGINLQTAKDLTKKDSLPFWPYLSNILSGGFISCTIIIISWAIDYLVSTANINIPYLRELSYWVALPVFILYSLTSILLLLFDAIKIIQIKCQYLWN
jgi:hypothetical protein